LFAEKSIGSEFMDAMLCIVDVGYDQKKGSACFLEYVYTQQ